MIRPHMVPITGLQTHFWEKLLAAVSGASPPPLIIFLMNLQEKGNSPLFFSLDTTVSSQYLSEKKVFL